MADQGLGNFARECPNKQLVTLTEDTVPLYDMDESCAEEPTQEIIYPDKGVALVTQHVLSTAAGRSGDDTLWLRNNIFRTRCTSKGKVCAVVIDGGSCENMVATSMVEKLGLLAEPHPDPYQLTWLKKGNVVKVNQRCLVQFTIGNRYSDEVWCEVIPMDACHILLGRPWQYDKRTRHDGFHNTYSFKKDGILITLAQLDIRESGTEALILSKYAFLDFTHAVKPPFMFGLLVTEVNPSVRQQIPFEPPQFDDPEMLLNEEPDIFGDANIRKEWRDAMTEEINSIERNVTWKLVDLPKHQKPIGLKWVFKVKKGASGKISRYKARLVAKGYVQKKGIHYTEAFAPVMRLETVRLILALSARIGWEVHHLDVNTIRPKASTPCLEHSPILKDQNFKRSPREYALYRREDQRGVLIVGVYVDDLIVTGSSAKEIENFKNQMRKNFEMSDLGQLSYYLGIEVVQQNRGIAITIGSFELQIPSEQVATLHQSELIHHSELIPDSLGVADDTGRPNSVDRTLSLFPFRYQTSFGLLTCKGDGPLVLGQGEPKSVNTSTLMERGLPVCSNKIHSMPFINSGSIPMEGSAECLPNQLMPIVHNPKWSETTLDGRSSERKRMYQMSTISETRTYRLCPKSKVKKNPDGLRELDFEEGAFGDDEDEEDEVIEFPNVKKKKEGWNKHWWSGKKRKMYVKGLIDYFVSKGKGKVVQTSIIDACDKELRGGTIQTIVAFFYQAGIAFNVVKLDSFKEMLLDKFVEQIGEANVVQSITDNGSNFKLAVDEEFEEDDYEYEQNDAIEVDEKSDDGFHE
ncbi:hypothetical protein E3N88_35973 [Mikania micrantha]|uniref:Reverse transcriptase Ty1/copia-type domain-containing protein n=1 Tax=Mikania micrantha TaxID=192012 RepID=A0A5N6M580_9ASTR|nr:hypothetical protein E3N88_35973 [Mikania micrantha]